MVDKNRLLKKMNVFLIHRSSQRKKANKILKKSCVSASVPARITILKSSTSENWKIKAERLIDKSEAVVIFDPTNCDESENIEWELEKAEALGKPIIELREHSANVSAKEALKSLYELKNEFDDCFKDRSGDQTELYKMMVESSEQLIQRRQRTNAFFITVIGSLIAIASFVVEKESISKDSIWIIYGFSAVALLLCNSWRNLIDNYGKLNSAKYDVILKLEESLESRIFFAEWIALGKGARPKKYKSFTSTEKNVPLFFGFLILILTIIASIYSFVGSGKATSLHF